MKKLSLPALAFILGLANAAIAADDTYEVSKTQPKAEVGAKATASVTIVAKKGWHLNGEAPLTLKLVPGPGVAVEKGKLARADLAVSKDTLARFDVGVTPSAVGAQSIDAEAGFVLCQESACRPIKEKLTLVVDAKPAGGKPEKSAEPKTNAPKRKNAKGG